MEPAPLNKGEIAVWLYGSYARGCPDRHSDLDILVAIDSLERANEIEREIKLEFCRASLSCYTWDEISRMAKHGSLFLQHLKLEATPLYETALCAGKLKKILGALGNYRFTHRDLRGFWTVIDDVEEELNNKAEDSYELAVLATVMRHSAILGCWLLDQPSFGRIEPVSRFVRLRGIRMRGGGASQIYMAIAFMPTGGVGRNRCASSPSGSGWRGQVSWSRMLRRWHVKEIEDCLRQLNKVRSVAREEEVAYVARSRLGRLVLAMVRLVGRVAEVPVEDRPLRLASPQDAPPEIQTLVNLCHGLNETTKTLVQPSEPLDQRWRAVLN